MHLISSHCPRFGLTTADMGDCYMCPNLTIIVDQSDGLPGYPSIFTLGGRNLVGLLKA